MLLSELPQELLLLIADHLHYQRDLNAFCRANRHLYQTLNTHLYKHNIRYYKSDALQWAALHGRLQTAQIALEHGADIQTIAPVYGRAPPSHVVSQFGRGLKGAIKYSIAFQIKGEAQFYLRGGPVTPLVLAAGAGYLDLAYLLVQKGADVDSSGDSGLTPLKAAADGGHTRMVALLLQSGATVSLRGSSQSEMAVELEHALELAAKAGHTGVVQVLLQHGADAKEVSSSPALCGAASNGYTKIMRILLDQGADPKMKCESGWTPLLYAIHGDHLEVVRLLLGPGEDLESRDLFGVTLLLHCSRLGAVKVCKLLLELGAEVNATDETHQTALWCAYEQGNEEMVNLLLKYGARKYLDDRMDQNI